MSDPCRLLVIDDEEVVLASVERLLVKDHITIEKVPSAEAALERLRSRDYDIIITDLMMPRMDGIEFLRRIREEGCLTPTILITGYATIRSAMDALKAGAVEYLAKPFTRSELRGAVHRALRRQSLPGGSPDTHAGGRRPAGPATGIPATTGTVYRLPEHTWLRVTESGTVIVGMDSLFAQIVGELTGIDMPSDDEFIEQGRACFMAVDGDGISHYVCSPASGRVIRTNPRIVSTPRIVNEDPEGEGWLIEMVPMDLPSELRNLVVD